MDYDDIRESMAVIPLNTDDDLQGDDKDFECLQCKDVLKSPVTFKCQLHSVCKDPCFRELH